MNNEYEDLNKIFVDPKKAQEEAAAAAKKAEEEELAVKAKAAATVVRKAAGQVWEDSSLLEFDESKLSAHQPSHARKHTTTPFVTME
jgi:hypothetical protein